MTFFTKITLGKDPSGLTDIPKVDKRAPCLLEVGMYVDDLSKIYFDKYTFLLTWF